MQHLAWVSIASVVALAGCPFYDRRPPTPIAPGKPMPIEGINSPYDDFNSADMSPNWLHQLVFSTNRGSEGTHFDLYKAVLDWGGKGLYDRTSPTPLSVVAPEPFLPALMSERDERGPIAITHYEWSETGEQKVWFAVTSDRDGGKGGLDLYATECKSYYQAHRKPPCEDATALTLLSVSSEFDDAYLSKPFDERRVLLASNRDAGAGKPMDLYAARWSAGKQLVDAPETIARIPELSSGADDTAPYVFRAHDRPAELVFVSNRAGGGGEHDIYCSRWDAKQERWSAPKNLGPVINSAKDEYRPIVIEVNKTEFLIFSSTRPGGKGGYDLYMVGYPGCS